MEMAVAITAFSGIDLLFTRLLYSYQARCS
jgi:hypothetical protein